jgi:hypothetical protein
MGGQLELLYAWVRPTHASWRTRATCNRWVTAPGNCCLKGWVTAPGNCCLKGWVTAIRMGGQLWRTRATCNRCAHALHRVGVQWCCLGSWENDGSTRDFGPLPRSQPDRGDYFRKSVKIVDFTLSGAKFCATRSSAPICPFSTRKRTFAGCGLVNDTTVGVPYHIRSQRRDGLIAYR